MRFLPPVSSVVKSDALHLWAHFRPKSGARRKKPEGRFANTDKRVLLKPCLPLTRSDTPATYGRCSARCFCRESGNITSDISGIIKKLHKKSFSKKISYTVFTDKAKARIDPAHAAPPTAFILIPKLPHRNQFLYPQVYCSCLLWSFAMFALPFLDLCEAFFETRLQALIRRLIILTICEGIRQTLHSGDFFLGIVCVLITLAVV